MSKQEIVCFRCKQEYCVCERKERRNNREYELESFGCCREVFYCVGDLERHRELRHSVVAKEGGVNGVRR